MASKKPKSPKKRRQKPICQCENGCAYCPGVNGSTAMCTADGGEPRLVYKRDKVGECSNFRPSGEVPLHPG